MHWTQSRTAPPRRRITAAAAAVGSALVMGVVLAACGSNGTASSAGGSSTTTTAASSPSTTGASDAATAHAQLLPASAYPSGWKGQGSGSENTQASFFGGFGQSEIAQLAGCLGISTTGIDPNPVEAADQEYDDPNSDLSATDSVEVFPTTAAAVADVQAAGNDKAPTCLVQFMGSRATKSAPKGMTLGTLTASKVSIPTYGAHDAAILASVPFKYQGLTGTLYLEDVAVQQGRSESVLQFMDSEMPPSSTVDQLVATAAAQLQGATT